MKLSNKYIAFASVALLMASCDLDKFPEGDYISEEQKEDIINGRPNLITAEVNAMAAKLNTFGTISDDATTYHNDLWYSCGIYDIGIRRAGFGCIG